MTREEFVAEVRKLAELIDNDEAIAEQFEVSISTVRRWLSGAACPMARMRELIVKEMKDMLEE